MIDKLLAELSKAKSWMPTQVLVDKVGARNTTNVSLRLKDLEKNGSAVSRSRMEFGIKVIEWRHADKPDVGDFVPGGRGAKAAVVKKSLTTEMPTNKECCNAAKVVATTASSHVAGLRQEIADLTAQSEEEKRLFHAVISDMARINEALDLDPDDGGAEPILSAISDMNDVIDQANGANSKWLELAQEFECKSIPELRVFIDSLICRIDGLKKAKVAEPKKPVQPRKPFSITGLVGYHAGSDKVTLFLDRRLSARSVTFPAAKLAQLADMAGV